MKVRAFPTRKSGRSSESTRIRLLEATLDALSELGYSKTTTVEITKRSGVSRGGMLHHFPTSAHLVAAAITHAARSHEEKLNERVGRRGESESLGRLSAFIDAAWEVYRGPDYYAFLELWVAARTDENLRSSLLQVEPTLAASMRSIGREAMGTEDRDALLIFELTMALMRGLAVTTILGDESRASELLRRWMEIIGAHLHDQEAADGRGAS